MDSQADTYIEECFEKKCSAYKDFREVLNQWRKDKDTFSECTSITNFDFQHYSMHDKTHSIAILQNIEMILGRKRVEALNASNLWLLLETSYCHDIGMSVTYKKLCSIWESDEFQKFIIDSLDSEMADNRKAGLFYEKLNALVHNKTQLTAASQVYDIDEFDDEFDELFSKKSWPVIGERYIMMLYTEYIRKLHPELSMNRILRYGSNDSAKNHTDKGDEDEDIINDEKKIPSRMYRTAALAAFLHGEDFDQIFKKVAAEENGFKGERMHPRFAAAMLRLGDLLDMDNNRFNIRMLNHMGLVPTESMLHLKKHKAITHLSYSKGIIEAEARSDEFEVCKTAQQWFHWLNEEVKNLICWWNKIVPPKLQGCRLNCCDLKIYYKDELFDASRQTKFVADSARVYKMLIGNNIYESRLDFIREYLQNAMDASKMQLWLNLKAEKEFQDNYSWETITPFDLKPEKYEAYRLEVEARVDWDAQKVVISFQDHGIGMEKDCVSALSHIASDSWKKRETYAKEIPNMPMWLRPTGGFGIGIQSAFMITDCVEFITKTEQESCGRKICMENSRKGGKVSEYACREAENGTKVLIKIPLMSFIKATMEKDAPYLKEAAWDIFDRREISKMIIFILHNYIERIADYSLFPITIYGDEEKEPKTVGMKWLLYDAEDDKKNKKPVQLEKQIKISGTPKNQWQFQYTARKNKFFLWDPKNYAIVIYVSDNGQPQKNSCYYKGILINGEEFETSGNYAVKINYFDYGVSKYLTINRDNFHQRCKRKFQKDVTKYKDLYAQILAADIAHTADIAPNIDHAADMKDCEITKQIGLISLVNNSIGVFDMNANTYEQLLAIVSDKISIKRLNLSAITKFLLGNVENALSETSDYVSIPESILFVQDEIPLGILLENIKKNPYFFYEARKENFYTRISTYHFAQKVLNAKQLPDKNCIEKSMPQNEDAICQVLAQKESYIITETEICRILQEYSVMNNFIDIKEDNQYLMRIACAKKTDGKNTSDNKGIKEFIQKHLAEELEKGKAYPIVLKTSKIIEDDLKYHLWIKKIFSNTQVIPLDDQRPSASDRYLILPITQSTWMRILSIIRSSGVISKQEYNELAKQRSELRLLADWTYAYQDNEPKLKKEQIYEQYEELLDIIYSEYISDISGEVYYHLIHP